MSEDVGRRDLFRLTAGGLLVARLGKTETPVFFSKEEYAAVDELMDTIIPTDSHSPGAKAAGCADYLDRQLAESTVEEEKNIWRSGIKALEDRCKSKFDKSIVDSTPEQRISLLEEVSRNEKHAGTPEEKFFNTLKHATAFAYYSSSIGIHKEMEYKGNVYLPEFVGTELK
jgi:glucoside 3-dehydrogenase (cytochrome c) hitch-hiker subunit